jgi:hypothetical protein
MLLGHFFISSCGRPQRKKMPEFYFSGKDFEMQDSSHHFDDLPFEISDTTVYLHSRSTLFLVIGIPDERNDSLALSIVRSHAHITESIICGIYSLGEKGVVINLAISRKPEQMDFIIKSKDGNQMGFPIVLLWDENSARRAINFIGAVNQIKEFTLIQLSRQSRIYQSEDCFQFETPTFSE